jgi:sulfatase modifying factor 1
MVRIPEGWFVMGCHADCEVGRDDERPAHRVWVDAFELAACQLTNAEYALFLAATQHANPLYWHDPNFNDPQQPVVAPSWFDAAAYCEWLSFVSGRVSGRRYRLPTEAEWERAARGGVEGRLYTWGDAPPDAHSNYAARWKTAPERVGLTEPTAYGLFNMGDNVHEWCADWYDAHYYAASPDRNPPGPPEGARRASRGGSWRHHIKISRVAARSSIPPEFKYADYGFRIARDL